MGYKYRVNKQLCLRLHRLGVPKAGAISAYLPLFSATQLGGHTRQMLSEELLGMPRKLPRGAFHGRALFAHRVSSSPDWPQSKCYLELPYSCLPPLSTCLWISIPGIKGGPLHPVKILFLIMCIFLGKCT